MLQTTSAAFFPPNMQTVARRVLPGGARARHAAREPLRLDDAVPVDDGRAPEHSRQRDERSWAPAAAACQHHLEHHSQCAQSAAECHAMDYLQNLPRPEFGGGPVHCAGLGL